MHLWTEYEGRTIAEHYTLGKLLRSEGRNGFFATADKDGHPAVIRLTEAHFDEDEQLRRWRHVAEVHQDNLIEIEQVGRTTFEGVALTYALMEPDDANLGDVLKERPLTTAEALQVARAVLSALRALHSSGLVHEHVEPANVLAVGETVKLRSDCVRECVADGEFNTEDACAELRRRDIHDFGLLLLRCVTLENEWIPAHNNLPDPFKRIIPRALDGSWTLEQLGNAVDPALFAPRPPATPTAASAPAPAASTSAPAAAPAAISTTPSVSAGPTQPAPSPNSARAPLVPPSARQGATQAVIPAVARPTPPHAKDAEPTLGTHTRHRPELEHDEPTPAPSRLLWAGVAVAALLLVLIGWHFFAGSKPAAPAANTSSAPIVSSGEVSNPASSPAAPVSQAPVTAPAPTAAAPAPAANNAADGTHAAAGGSGWYVIAYTYNHEGQAAEKAKRLRRNHNSMNPQVFTPTGHAPYFVSLGGPMASQSQAEAVYRHARRSGLPRDTFVRHY